jgi:nitroreductase
MEALEAIHTRRSVRQFDDRPIDGAMVDRLLAAAMMAPSARNAQPWHFVVIDDRALLDRIAEINPNAEMARRARLAILVCGDLELELSGGYWVVDCAAATQNLLLAAHALGLGAVWTGVYPRQERMEGIGGLAGLPPHVKAHSLVVLGYPAEQPASHNRYRADRVRRNRW